MSINKTKLILKNNHAEIAFIIGNGINRYYKTSKSWEDVLLELWKKYSYETLSFIPRGISLTEVYDILDLQNRNVNNIENKLQKDVKEIYSNIKINTCIKPILKKIKQYNSPILTTNYDDFIVRDLNLNYFSFSGKDFTDFYPWESYYSTEELNNPLSSFGVWHINGMIRYHRSIKLGLSHYMGNVNRARRWIHGNIDKIEFTEKDKKIWPGMKSWLQILFNKSIFILGLGLEENEVFLRWLLIERSKYFRQFPERKKQSWYLKVKSENQPGKDFYLRQLGFEILEVEQYDDIYNTLWK